MKKSKDTTKRTKIREHVYKVIDEERKYQGLRWGIKLGSIIIEPKHSVGDFIVFMEEFLKRAKQKLTCEIHSADAMCEIRKVTALGIACMEENGRFERNENLVKNKRTGRIYKMYP